MTTGRMTTATRRYAWVLAAPLLLASLLTGLGPAAASALAATCHPGPVTQPLSPADQVNRLNGVAVLSACNVWVVGYTRDSVRGERTLIEHWDGTSWTVVSSPHPSTGSMLNSVRAISPTSIWAVGELNRSKSPGSTRKTLILHYDGTKWTTVRSPSPGRDNELDEVRWVSAKDAWVVGFAFDGTADKTLILRWNGSRWRRVTSPNPAADDELFGVAATSRRDAWAVGQSSSRGGGNHTFILHWNGTRWKQAQSPSLPVSGALSSVGVTSPASGWAVGHTAAGSTEQTLALRWNGHTWTKVTTPAGPSGDVRVLGGVAAISPGNAWAVGEDLSADAQAIILHWDGKKWLPVALPGSSTGTRLVTVAASSASNVWAVGDSGNGRQALVFHP
jgi:hypothetical protein